MKHIYIYTSIPTIANINNISAPPIFSDIDKFNSTNWPTWSNIILITTQLKKAQGYLDGTIKNPKLNTTSGSPDILAKILFLDNNPTV